MCLPLEWFQQAHVNGMSEGRCSCSMKCQCLRQHRAVDLFTCSAVDTSAPYPTLLQSVARGAIAILPLLSSNTKQGTDCMS
jgi:hypothetical protein